MLKAYFGRQTPVNNIDIVEHNPEQFVRAALAFKRITWLTKSPLFRIPDKTPQANPEINNKKKQKQTKPFSWKNFIMFPVLDEAPVNDTMRSDQKKKTKKKRTDFRLGERRFLAAPVLSY